MPKNSSGLPDANDGSGGHGLNVEESSLATVLDCTLHGGQGGVDGVNWNGNVEFLPGSAPGFRVLGRRLIPSRTRVSVSGSPGGEAFLLVSSTSTFDARFDTLRGVLHLLAPTYLPLGTIPPGGVLTVDVALPPPTHFFPGWDWRLQAMAMDSAHVRTLSPPSLGFLQEYTWVR